MCCYGQLVTNLLQLDLSVSLFSFVQFSSVLSVVSVSLQRHGLQHARLPNITNSRSLLKLMSIVLVMPSNHLILSSTSPPAFNLS